ncbi:MAG TPA: alternative ribosome rescue aminoacyl-tRNA hydrolase ArfB [Rhizomicrobium sp.]|jgi:ribosome-associated protein|nr:alternative ribosome rescue aminoacyl-tRNA hydrolase ArfB [Rhizomicrobium sp.]
MADIRITDEIAIDEGELLESFILATGPGGQNVNKVASAVQLRFDVAHSPSLPHDLRARLIKLAGRRLSKSGELILTGRRYRSQEQNREDVRARLVELLREAATPPRPRRKTRPPLSSKKQRRENKMARGQLKRQRARPRDE